MQPSFVAPSRCGTSVSTIRTSDLPSTGQEPSRILPPIRALLSYNPDVGMTVLGIQEVTFQESSESQATVGLSYRTAEEPMSEIYAQGSSPMSIPTAIGQLQLTLSPMVKSGNTNQDSSRLGAITTGTMQGIIAIQ